MLKPHAHRPDLLARVEAAWRSPSLYDEALMAVARRGIAVPASHLERDWTEPYQASAGVQQAWREVYRDSQRHWDLYQLAEKLVDLEDALRQWRFRHVISVERVIGFKCGTGGTGGVSYLSRHFRTALRRVAHVSPRRATARGQRACGRQVPSLNGLGCGSGATCWRKLRVWQAAGIWAQLHRVPSKRLA